jgi:hypothetical protein
VSAASASRVGRHGVEFLSFCFFLSTVANDLLNGWPVVLVPSFYIYSQCIFHALHTFDDLDSSERLKDDVISSIALAVIPARPPVPRSPHELSVLLFTSPEYDDTCNVVLYIVHDLKVTYC